MIDYCLVGWFFLGSYRLVSIADSSNQDGGDIPLSFFGRPRTRRSFCLCYVHSILRITPTHNYQYSVFLSRNAAT